MLYNVMVLVRPVVGEQERQVREDLEKGIAPSTATWFYPFVQNVAAPEGFLRVGEQLFIDDKEGILSHTLVNTNKTILKEVQPFTQLFWMNLQALEESLTEEKLVHPLFKDAKRLSEIGNDSPMTDEEKRALGLL